MEKELKEAISKSWIEIILVFLALTIIAGCCNLYASMNEPASDPGKRIESLEKSFE